jgi:hypothetical protein
MDLLKSTYSGACDFFPKLQPDKLCRYETQISFLRVSKAVLTINYLQFSPENCN